MPQSSPPNTREPTIFDRFIAEVIGTFILIFFGLGSVHAAVLLGAQSGVWQVAIVWGVAIMLAAYAIGGVSGAHINPAMTIALAVWGKHPWRQVVPYIVAQLVGAIGAAAVLYAIFAGFIAAKEEAKQVQRGEPGSIVTAMCYGEYFPNPGSLATSDGPFDPNQLALMKTQFTHTQAFVAEVLGTLLLAFVVFAVTDKANGSRPADGQAPIFIGLTVSVLISVLGPLTQACFNPARDFGPRLFAYFAGWGEVAIPGTADLSWLTVYIAAPTLGAILGGAVYRFFVWTGLPKAE